MYQSILVPLDGSVFSAAALPVAAAFARRTGARLHLVTVYDPSSFLHFTPGDVNMATFTPAAVDDRCERLRSSVTEQAASISSTGINATGTYLEGTIVEALAEHIELTNADLVIMTTHGRSGVDRLRLGSVASSVLSRSPVPVMLLRPIGAESPHAGYELPTGTLLLPLDGSPFAETMLAPAAQFASALGLAVDVVAVCTPLATQSTRRYLERVADKLNSAPSIAPTITVLSETSAARALIDYVAQSHPAVIAMATHGRSGILRLVLGSVTAKVLRRTQQPMLLYRPESDTLSV